MCDSVNVNIKIKRSDGCSAVKKIECKFDQEVVFRRNYKKTPKQINNSVFTTDNRNNLWFQQ